MILLTFLALFATASSTIVRYDNFTLYRLVPKNLNEVNIIANLESSYLTGYDFWTHPKDVGLSVDVLVSPDKKNEIIKLIRDNDMQYEILMENIQEQIDKEANLNKPSIKGRLGALDWTRYYRVDEIYNWLRSLAEQYPDKVTLIEGGRSYEGRQILGVKVSFKKGNERRGVWIDSLIHAREWIAGATTTYILNELLTRQDLEIKQIAESHDWYFFPVLNPDGYEFTHTSNRLWRKTRRPYGILCYGADPNRNWAYRWNTGGASSQPCSDTYAGPNAFSEIETESLSRYIQSISQNLKAYISFHSYSQMILLPYGHTTQHLDNYNEVRAIGLEGAKSIASVYGTQYVVGNVAETIYVATGASMDWVKGSFQVPFAITFELRDKGNNGFILPPSEIIPSGIETLAGVVTMLRQADRLNATIV